jgi:hypothetical protein
MARAQGARAQMALAFETVYGTAPATGYRFVPFASTTLGSEQPLLASELLGYGRDPQAPLRDAFTADGDVVIPIDVENFGLWLKGAFGSPVTTGTVQKVHTFQSGGWTLPSLASIHTSLLSTTHGCWKISSRLEPEFTTAAEVLRDPDGDDRFAYGGPQFSVDSVEWGAA